MRIRKSSGETKSEPGTYFFITPCTRFHLRVADASLESHYIVCWTRFSRRRRERVTDEFIDRDNRVINLMIRKFVSIFFIRPSLEYKNKNPVF